MRPIYSLFFDFLTDPLGLPIHPLWEYVLLIVIGEIAFRIAWNASPGGFGGSTIHWVVRIIAFVIMWAATYAVIAIVKFIIAHWIPIVCIACGLIIVGIVFVITYRRKERILNI